MSQKIANNYNKANIAETLSQLKLTQKGSNIFTHYEDRLIANTSVSDRYKLFDFPNFALDVVKEIENYFIPESYILKITQGQQELRLIGEEVIINGDKYQKMFNIFNSTDKSRALGLNAGLIRFVCTNGMVIGLEDEYSALKVKHYKNTMDGKVDQFLKTLDNFDLNIKKQSTVIEKLSGNHVSFKELADKLAKDKKGIITPNKAMQLRAFGKKLLSSETDRLENLAKEQIELLNNPHLFQEKGFDKVDVEMSSYQALNCYTEIFRNYNSQVLSRETNRILELV